MAVTPADRPLDVLRDQTIDRLIMNYGHGRLSLEAFQRRLDQAFDAKQQDTLTALVADLDLEVDAGFIEQKRAELGDRDGDDDEAVEHIVNIFSGNSRSGPWTVPAELRVINLFGGIDLDFSQATFSSPVTRVRMLCLCGGVDIFVPEGINATSKAFAIFGGIDNQTPTSPDRNAPRLIVEGLVMFGGCDVRIRKSLKERALEFADRLRAWLDGER